MKSRFSSLTPVLEFERRKNERDFRLVSEGVEMETRHKKVTDVREFARQLILSKEYQSTLKRRVLAGQINRDFARTLLGYARSPQGSSPELGWLGEPPAIDALEKLSKTGLFSEENEHET